MGIWFKSPSINSPCKWRFFAFITGYILLLNCSFAFSQPRHQIGLFSHWSQYFQQEQAYSFPVIPWLIPALNYSFTPKPDKFLALSFGAEASFLPVIAQNRFSENDPVINPPNGGGGRAGYFVDLRAINLGLNCALRLHKKNTPHAFKLGGAVLVAIPQESITGISSSISSPDPMQKPFVVFGQFYNFRPDGLLAVRLQAGYQYHFTLLKQPFFTMARVDYQLNNRPEVLFRVINDQDAVVACFSHTFPRFYGFLGLGWCWGTKK